MSIEVCEFPQEIVEAVCTLPDEHFSSTTYTEQHSYMQSRNLPKTDYVGNHPVILGLNETQLQEFASDLYKPTPTQALSGDIQQATRFGALQLALGASIGTPLSIPEVRDGALVQDIFPKEGSGLAPNSSYGSGAEFTFHNDLSFLDDPEIPDFVTLGCIRNTERAATYVASIEDVLSELRARDVAELQKPQFVLRHTYHRGLESEWIGEKQSAVILDNGQVCLGVDMTPQTSAAEVALQSLRNALWRIAIPYNLKPGEVLVLPNRFTVHARDSFTMSANAASRRWLQRINIAAKS